MIAQQEKWVRISAVPADAQAVYLMAAFNNWSTTATPMRAVHLGVWEAAVPPDSDDCEQVRLFVFERGSRVGHMTLPVDFDPPPRMADAHRSEPRVRKNTSTCRIQIVRAAPEPALRD